MRQLSYCALVLVASLVPVAAAAEEKPAGAALRVDYGQHFVAPIPFPVMANEQAQASGAIAVETEDVLSKPSALRLDCTKTKERVIVVNFAIPPKELEAYRDKPLQLRCQVKRVRGAGEVSVRMRCFGEAWKFLMAGKAATLRGELGKWEPLTLRCQVPTLPEVKFVDFHLGVENTPDPPVILLDDCVLEELDPGQERFESGFAAYAGEPAKDPLPLVAAGKPVATLVTGEKPTPTVQYAIQELNEHLQLSTGAKLPVAKEGQPVEGPAIHVGSTALSRRLGLAPEFLAPDTWVVRRVGNALILAGGDDASGKSVQFAYGGLLPYGTLYAAYEFLERAVGVRWYWPGDLGRVVPKHADLSVGDVRWQGAPSYQTRFCWYAIHKDPDIPAEESWKWWRRMRWGGIGGSAIANHSFGRWNKEHGEKHPDWFALQRNGRRLNNPDAVGGESGHLCLTNPEVFAQVVAEKRDAFDKTPWLRFSAVMPGDSDDLYHCQCQACQALVRPQEGRGGQHSHAVWSFVNQVAAEVRKTHPDRFITCCAYGSYRTVPADVYLEPNVAVTLCAGHFPARLWEPSVKADYVKWIDEWSRKSANLYVWDYWNNPRYAKGVHGAPAVYPHAIQEWLLLERGRVKGHAIEMSDIDSEGNSINGWADWMLDSVNVYVAMRLLWNLDQDVDAILVEMYDRFYGPAGPSVKRFNERLEAAYADPNGKGGPDFAWDFNTCWQSTYPPKLVEEAMRDLRQAVKATEGKEPYHARAVKTLNGYLPFERASRRYSAAAARPVANAEIAVAKAPAPVVDGSLAETCWKDAAVADGFVDSFNSPELRAKTEVRFVRDDAALHLGIRASLPGPTVKMSLPEKSVDADVWEQESVEVFFVQGARKYQFLVGPGDVYADNYHPDRSQDFKMEMFRWNCAGVRYATRRGEGEWMAELSIPLASLELPPPTKAEPWRVNFCRNHFYTLDGRDVKKVTWQRELSTWRPTFGSFHNVEHYGTLFLVTTG